MTHVPLPAPSDLPDPPRELLQDDAGPTAVGQELAALVEEALDDDQRRMLFRLLSHHLAVPSIAALRYARLGLLIRMAARGFEGSEREYESERLIARDAHGEWWPSAQALRNAYGSWPTALHQAQRFARDGSASRVAFNLKHAIGYVETASKLDCLDAVRRAFDCLGHWPNSPWEYQEWTKVTRLAWELAGRDRKKRPRLPGLRAFDHWGGFDVVIREAARRHEEDRRR